MSAKKLKDELARIATRMRDLTKKALDEDRGLTAEEEQEWNNLRSAFDQKEKLLEQAEYAESRQAQLDEAINRTVLDENGKPVRMSMGKQSGPGQERQQGGEYVTRVLGQELRSPYASGQSRRVEDPEMAVAFDAFLRFGVEGLTTEHRQLIHQAHQRAQAIGTDSAGGYLVPEGFSNELEVALKQFSGLRNVARVLPTATGNPLPWPTVNDTSNTGALLNENTQDAELDATFGVVNFGAFKYTSRIVRVPVELLQDSFFDLQDLLARLFGERLGRITSTHYITGTGSGQPRGLTVAATSGKTAAAQTAVTFQELQDLKHSVDPAYRFGARWLFNDTTLKAVKQLKDDENRPLWQPNIADEVPATLDGDRYQIDQAMPAMTAGLRPIAYGDMSKYVIRDVMGFTMSVMRERYADFHQVGFVAIMRTDGNLVDAGTGPVKVLTMAAA